MTSNLSADPSDCSPVLVAFGANQNFGAMDPAATILAAFAALNDEGLTVQRHSGLFRTPSFPTGSGPDYVNAAALVLPDQPMEPARILQALHRVEARFGRERLRRWGMRTLDIDLLACGDSVMPDRVTQRYWQDLPAAEQQHRTPAKLILPHPRLQDRAFVLVPLSVVAADWLHPVLGQTVAQMLAAIPAHERTAVTRLAGSAPV